MGSYGRYASGDGDEPIGFARENDARRPQPRVRTMVSTSWMQALANRMPSTQQGALYATSAHMPRQEARGQNAPLPHRTSAAQREAADFAEAMAPMATIAVTEKRRAELNEKFGTKEKREEAREVLRQGRVAAAHAALSNATWTQNVTIMRFWFEFCELEGADPAEFGKVPGDEAPRPPQLAWEDEVLARFSVYVTENPRKKGQTHNTGNTAGGYVSHVRTYYEFRLDPPRRVGGSGVSETRDGLGHALRRCLKGLRKLHPSDPNHRKKAAVLKSHLMALKQLLDMRDPFGAMLRAFVCTCWQGGRRSGELVRSKKRTGVWDPKFDMHRGRLQWDWDGSTCRRARIALAPDKADPTGEQGHKVFLPYAQNADINAAAAIAHMLALDPTESGEGDRTPLFRDTRGGWVWT